MSTRTTFASKHGFLARRRVLQTLQRLGLTGLLATGGVIFLIPFAWMLTTSVKPVDQIYQVPPVWIPREIHWNWYIEPWKEYGFLRYYRNTIIICAANQIGVLLSCSAAAFAFARLRFWKRDLLFVILLSTLMLPEQVTMIPMYVLYTRLHWIDTFKPLVIPTYFATNAFTVFLFRQYFMTISTEIDDAARIDGASIPDLYWRIILPLAKPALGVAAIMQFTYDWNSFFYPLIYLNTDDKFTVAIALRLLYSTLAIYTVQVVMAMTVVSIIPVLVLFFVAQRYFVQGIVVTGLKG